MVDRPLIFSAGPVAQAGKIARVSDMGTFTIAHCAQLDPLKQFSHPDQGHSRAAAVVTDLFKWLVATSQVEGEP